MTKYSENFFDPTPGLLEQLVYAVIAQNLANKDYVPDVLATDFTTESVKWNVTLDAVDNKAEATLNLSMAFVTLPYARQILADREGFERRVRSFNSTSIDTIGLNHQSDYPANSFRFQNPPPYLQDFSDDANMLERRIVWMCLQIQAVESWIVRWNNCARLWLIRKYLDNETLGELYSSKSESLTELAVRRDALLEELNHPLIARFAKFTDILESETTANSFSEASSDQFETAEASQNYYNNNVVEAQNSDPGSPSNSGYISSGILESLEAQGDEPEYGGDRPDSPDNKEPESPTLPNC